MIIGGSRIGLLLWLWSFQLTPTFFLQVIAVKPIPQLKLDKEILQVFFCFMKTTDLCH